MGSILEKWRDPLIIVKGLSSAGVFEIDDNGAELIYISLRLVRANYK